MRWMTWITGGLVCTTFACAAEHSQKQQPQSKAVDTAQHAGEVALEGLRAKLASASAEGDLCPDPSFVANLSDDGHVGTLTFAAAEVQPQDPEKLSNGTCRIALELDVPGGVQFRNATVFASGYVFAEEGNANLTLGYSYPASGARQTIEHMDLSGDEEYVFSDRFDIAWSPTCGASAQRPLRLVLDFSSHASGDAYFNVSAIDLNFDSDSTLEWRRCGSAG